LPRPSASKSLVVSVSVLFFGDVAGLMGAIVAVPIFATLQVVLREILSGRPEQLTIQRASGEAAP
jgi:predicted PurR-regulated permease PerM